MKEIDVDLDDVLYEKIKKYMKANNIASVEQAIQKLVDIGFKQEEKLEKLN